jgi:PAS domain S-box-containing protein
MRGVTILLGVLVASGDCSFGLNPSLDIGQYAHNSWTVRGGFSLGNIYAMAQTPDGYLWLGSEFGLFRFDGVRSVPWKPSSGQQIPNNAINRLLATRDGTLWIGTFDGLFTVTDGKLKALPEFPYMVDSLLEDREGTVWAGSYETAGKTTSGRLCAIRSAGAQCYGEDGAFGRTVSALYEDSSGNVWAGAQSGLWRVKPGPPRRYATPPVTLSAISNGEDGRPLIAMYGAGLMQLADEKVAPHPIRAPGNSNALLRDRDVNSNKLLRDRDGGLWIGTVERGLIRVHQGRTHVFSKSDGLSGDVILSLFEDREGNIWVATTGGIDRFRELSVTTYSTKQGLSSDAAHSVLATADGSVWIATHDGLTRWNNGQTTIFRQESGLPDDRAGSLFEDSHGRLWVSTSRGLRYFKNRRFAEFSSAGGEDVRSITGDTAGNLWLSESKGLVHLLEGRLVKQIPWSGLGRSQRAAAVLADRGGVWLSFWLDGGVSYVKDGRVQASYQAADGLGEGHVPALAVDSDGALWAATEDGGLSRLKDNRIATLTTRNGLPCNTVHWTIEDDDRSFWLYTGCGLVRVARSELDAWIADPKRRIETTVWDAGDGVRLRPVAASAYHPTVAKSVDGRVWFVTGEGVQVVDPRRLAVNKLPPPVHIEQISVNQKGHWSNLTGAAVSEIRLPARVRNLQIDFTALSLVAPEKVRFRYKLDEQDSDWREVVNSRQAQYTNLPPGHYHFRVTASNNSGIWNERGAILAFSVDPAYYQTGWFRLLCAAMAVAVLWGAWQYRVRRLRREVKQLEDVIETIPAMAWTVRPDGSGAFVNKRWTEYTGLSAEETAGSGWRLAVHPEDREQYWKKWDAALSRGEPFEGEARFCCAADGKYRWFLARGVPLRDKSGRVVRWYGILTDIEDRKRAEEDREKLRQLEADLAHINRVDMMGELAASIAHEVNQPLAGIVNNGSACLQWLSGDPPDVEEVREAVRDIVRDGRRAGEVIARIRGLTKRTAPPREELDLNQTVQEVLALVGDEAKRQRVIIRTHFAHDLSPVSGDRIQLQQVILNLVMNAIEAMSSVEDRTRELVINTRNADADHVQVSVEDSGPGLEPNASGKIFDAFYTTKASGMGMGLSISRSILQNHGGRLWATANNGSGASFHFSLPKHQEEAAHAEPGGQLTR